MTLLYSRRGSYICTIGCAATCPCSEVQACDVDYDLSGDDATVVIPDNGSDPGYTYSEGTPCIVFISDEQHPHPALHTADDGERMHEWSDGDLSCQLSSYDKPGR